jgi:hypothetical protein
MGLTGGWWVRLLPWRKRLLSGEMTAREALELVAFRNPDLHWESTEAGLCVLEVPLRRDGLARFLLRYTRAPDVKRVELDELGSDVWELCDGERTLEQIVRELMRKHRLGRLEAEMPLRQFVVTLHKRRFIGLRKKAGEPAPAKKRRRRGRQ